MPPVKPKKKDNLIYFKVYSSLVFRDGCSSFQISCQTNIWETLSEMKHKWGAFRRDTREPLTRSMSTIHLSRSLALHNVIGTLTFYSVVISSSRRLFLVFAFAGGAASHVKLHNTVVCLLCAGWKRQSYPACSVSQKASAKTTSIQELA